MYYLVKDPKDNYYKIVHDGFDKGGTSWESSKKEALVNFSVLHIGIPSLEELRVIYPRIRVLLTFDQSTNPEYFI